MVEIDANNEIGKVKIEKETLQAISLLVERRQNPTINDVAEIAKVSKKTVSRIINNSPNVKNETREIVNEIIRLMGFKPNPQARALAFRRSFLIGLIYDNPNAQYVVNVQAGILNALKGTGNELIVHPCKRDSKDLLEEIEDFILMQRLSGIVILPPIAEDLRLIELFKRLEVPFIRITAREGSKSNPPIESAQIVSLDASGCTQASNLLANLGHKRIGFIGGNQAYPSAFERRKGFDEGLAVHGLSIPKEIDVSGDYSFESGYLAALKILNSSNPPSAIIAANDEMAAGVYKAAHELQIKIPQELSVVGFDDSPLASRLAPALSTVRLPTHIMAEQAAKVLLNWKQDSFPSYYFESVLIERGSTASAKIL